MSEPKNIYAKFRMDEKRKLMKGFIISERREVVDNWTGDEPREEHPKKKTEAPKGSLFSNISKEFEKSMEVFQQAIPFFLASFPLMIRFMDDFRIRGFIKEHGKSIEEGEYRHTP